MEKNLEHEMDTGAYINIGAYTDNIVHLPNKCILGAFMLGTVVQDSGQSMIIGHLDPQGSWSRT